MQVTLKIDGLDEQLSKLAATTNAIPAVIARALFRIGGVWKRTAVDYAPISPTTSMLKDFSTKIKSGRPNPRSMFIWSRKGRMITTVKLTQFYEDRLSMLTSDSKRPMPGGLMRSIAFRSDESKVECFVPSNSLAGKYAFKIHEEKGRTWKERGPGTQAKGPQADDKFITRSANDRENDFKAIVGNEIDKLLGGNGK